EDATRLIKIFSLKDKATIEGLIEKHQQEPHLRVLQKEMAVELTTRIHGEKELQAAQQASKILFGKQVTEELKALPEKLLLEVFEGVPQHEAQKSAVEQGMDIVTFLAEESGVFSSKGEARRMLKSNAVSINKVKVDENRQITAEDLLNDKYILVQKGKKNYFLVRVK
ncbi:MAG: tyrosine--tRNA ligase, partial [Bacteroidota bacterium]